MKNECDKIIEQTREMVCRSHQTDNPPAESVILSLAAQVHLAREALRDLSHKVHSGYDFNSDPERVTAKISGLLA